MAHIWLNPKIICMLDPTISAPCTALMVLRNLYKQIEDH